jgi:glycosyltransferase involved in cell wall biosynthesis
MKLVYIANVRLPTEKAHGAQIMKTCEALADCGVETELMIPGRRTHINEDPFTYYGVRQNFRIMTIPVPDLIFLGAIGFGLTALMFSERVRWQKMFWDADVIYSRDAFVLLQYLLLGRTLVYEAHTRPTLISTITARHVHRLVVISEGLKRAYEKRNVASGRMIVAHDAVDLAPFEKHYDQKRSRDKLGIPLDKRVVMYVGRIDEAKGARVFAEAGDHAAPDTMYVAIGDGSLKETLSKKYPNVLFLPATKYSELPLVLAAADVLVVPNSAKDVNTFVYASPMKAFAYMAAHKPVVSADVPSLREIFGEDGAHYYIPDDGVDLAGKIAFVLENHKYVDALVHAAGRRVKQHSWLNRANVIIKHIIR